ncbi:MAG: hypothetical protein AAGA75_16540, partial [Cyanobacteria bacterium P01_E01_bin.6]
VFLCFVWVVSPVVCCGFYCLPKFLFIKILLPASIPPTLPTYIAPIILPTCIAPTLPTCIAPTMAIALGITMGHGIGIALGEWPFAPSGVRVFHHPDRPPLFD